MGETFAGIILRANGKEYKKRILVDTGATFIWIDSKILEKLGVKSIDTEEFETLRLAVDPYRQRLKKSKTIKALRFYVNKDIRGTNNGF